MTFGNRSSKRKDIINNVNPKGAKSLRIIKRFGIFWNTKTPLKGDMTIVCTNIKYISCILRVYESHNCHNFLVIIYIYFKVYI